MPDDSKKESGSAELAGQTTIVLVEDHTILRNGLRLILSVQDEFSVVGEAGNCGDGLRVVRDTSPDVVITDMDLPDRTGLTLIPDLKAFDDTIKIIVLTSRCTSELVRKVLDAGANAYIRKDAPPSELVRGVRAVMEGKRFLSANVLSSINL